MEFWAILTGGGAKSYSRKLPQKCFQYYNVSFFLLETWQLQCLHHEVIMMCILKDMGRNPSPPPLFTNTLSVIYNHKPSVKDLQYTRVTTIIVQATVCPGMGLGP